MPGRCSSLTEGRTLASGSGAVGREAEPTKPALRDSDRRPRSRSWPALATQNAGPASRLRPLRPSCKRRPRLRTWPQQVVVEEAGTDGAGLAPGEGDSSSGLAPGREAGSGVDRGGADPAAPSDAQLAVELRKLFGEPTALEQRTRKDVEGRYDSAATVAIAAEGAPRSAVAAAIAPRTLERASLDPATAAFIRAYSDAGPR